MGACLMGRRAPEAEPRRPSPEDSSIRVTAAEAGPAAALEALEADRDTLRATELGSVVPRRRERRPRGTGL